MKIETQSPIWTKSFMSISMTQLMVFTVFYALLTTLPLYVIHGLQGSGADGGLVITVMTVAAILIRLVSAKILEITGKRRGLILCAVAFAVTTVIYIGMWSLLPLLVLRFIHGLSFGLITTATGAIAAIVVPKERHGEGIGYFAMSGNIAVVVGPFIGLTLLQYSSFQTLFIILSIMSLGIVLFAALVQVPMEKEEETEPKKQKLSLHDFIETKAIPVSLIAALLTIAYASIMTFVSVYSEAIGLLEAASYFFFVYAVAMLISRPYFGKRFDRLGSNYAIIPGFLFFAVGLTMLSLTKSAWMLLLSAAVIGLGFGTLTPSLQTLAIQSAPASRSGHATATFFTLFDVGIALGSIIWGLVVASFSFETMYFMSAILVLIVMGLYLFVRRKNTVAT